MAHIVKCKNCEKIKNNPISEIPCFVPENEVLCGYFALERFKKLPSPKNLLSKNITDEDIKKSHKEAQLTIQNSLDLVWDRPAYAKRDMISGDILNVVARQLEIKKELDKDTNSVEDVQKLSKEYYYNSEMIDYMCLF